MSEAFKQLFYPRGVVGSDQQTDIQLESGGQPEGLPDCPGCDHRMQRLLSIDAATLQTVLGIESDNVDLVFCWRCAASVHFTYTGNLKNGFEFYSCWRDRNAGFSDEEEPFHMHPPVRKIFFADVNEDVQRLHLLGLSDAPYKTLQKEWNRIGLEYTDREPAYQIGGVPFLWDEPLDTKCQRCESPLKVVATVADDNGSETGWCGCDEVVMVFARCGKCGLIHASHQVD